MDWHPFNADLTHIHPARAMDFAALCAGLNSMVAAGLVSCRWREPLALYCYTKDCVYNGNWNEFTTVARGLIIDHAANKVVATPFPKFFNYGERLASIPDLPFQAFDKLDGSMITIFHHDGRWRAATKGSFDSEQAKWAERQLSTDYDSFLVHMSPGCTYICEAIYHANKIVVRYPYEALVLLAMYTEDGREVAYRNLQLIAQDAGWGVAERFAYPSLSHLLAESKSWPSTIEGRVLLFSNGLRLKLKGEDYCRVHRLISGCTPLALWEAILNDQSLLTMRLELPEEFWPDFDAITGILRAQLAAFVSRVNRAADSVAHLTDRDLGKTLRERIPAPWCDFVFHRRKKGTIVPDCDPTRATPVPLIRRSVFNHIRPTGNRLEGYTPSAAVHRVADETA